MSHPNGEPSRDRVRESTPEWTASALRRVDERWVTPLRVELLAEMNARYVDNGVLRDGYARALQDHCPSCDVCWAGADHRRPSVGPLPLGDSASMSWPWIGDHYRPGGLAFLSLNLNMGDDNTGTLGAEYEIAGEVLESFASGDRTPYFNSLFHWRVMVTAQAALASLDGGVVEGLTLETEHAAAVMHRIARVQAVKCTPLGESSKPTGAMSARCPERYAVHELRVLAPAVLIAFGTPAYDALWDLADEEPVWDETRDACQRGTITVGGRALTVFWLYHPTSRGGWERSQRDFVASLRASPLT